ncbi:MAG: family 10 glycosylhydrolase [Candidatus Eremiobacteraeota bacterium]|nr:family 10 glycosylhydrolase [Candidatus Eremiobacteraeota bacterium]
MRHLDLISLNAKRLFIIAAALIAVMALSPPSLAYWEDGPVYGAWISPDWFFPGTHRYHEYEIRAIVKEQLGAIARQGINTIFVETFLRGYSIAAIPDSTSGTLNAPSLGPLPPGQVPLYSHLNWPFRIENGTPIDTLQIFIDEAAPLGIKVHAWVHNFYWKMDNSDIVLPWHTGMTAWNGLLVEYLKSQKKLLESKPSTPRATVALLGECCELFSKTYDDFLFIELLKKYHVTDGGKPLGSLIRHIISLGGATPDFLLLGTPDDPFPSPKNRQLSAIYLNPEHPRVQEIIISTVEKIAKSHRNLAGIHLDHIRYAVDYQGFPVELQKREWDTIYFNQYNDDSMKLCDQYEAIVDKRRNVLTAFVNRIADKLSSDIAVSAAVLPANPPTPGEKVYFFTKNDFAGQDWYRWKADFVVPMMYGYIPWRIRSMVGKWYNDLTAIYGTKVPVRIFPGVSHLQKAKLGLLDLDTWVFFDLTLARDIRFERKVSEDFTIPKEN